MSLGRLIINKLQLKGNDILNIHKVGRNRIKLQLENFSLANKLLNSDLLTSNSLRGYIPETILFRKGIIRNVDTSLPTEEIKKIIQTDISIKDIRRITRKSMNTNNEVTYVDTQTLVITFRGQVLPNHVVTQCQNCYRFGHISLQCKSLPRCCNCGDNHSTQTCNQQNSQSICINCKGSHRATDLSCPVYEDHKKIKEYMAYNHVGFKEAKAKYPIKRSPPSLQYKTM